MVLPSCSKINVLLIIIIYSGNACSQINSHFPTFRCTRNTMSISLIKCYTPNVIDTNRNVLGTLLACTAKYETSRFA